MPQQRHHRHCTTFSQWLHSSLLLYLGNGYATLSHAKSRPPYPIFYHDSCNLNWLSEQKLVTQSNCKGKCFQKHTLICQKFSKTCTSSEDWSYTPCYRMESMKLKKLHGNVKAAGILFCVTGVTVLAFYQGPMLGSFNHHHLFQQANSSDDPEGNAHSKTQWVLGIFLMTLSNVLAGLWTVLLVYINPNFQISWPLIQNLIFMENFCFCKLHTKGLRINILDESNQVTADLVRASMEKFFLTWCCVFQGPLIEETSKLMNTALQISWAAVQAFVVAVAVERDFNKWKLGWDVELATVIYSVIWASSLWCNVIFDFKYCNSNDAQAESKYAYPWNK